MDKSLLIVRDLTENPEVLYQEGARRNLMHFARYLMPTFQVSPFHTAYYKVLNHFALKNIRNLIIQAPPQHGKALLATTPVLTTKGWRRHCDLSVGDYVFGADGLPKRVLWNSGTYLWPTRRITFSDGFSLVASPEHEWQILAEYDDHKGRREEIKETQHIFRRRHRRRPAIVADVVLRLPERPLPIDPYLFGLWLGDGDKDRSYISCGAEDIEALKPYADKIKRDQDAFRLVVNGLTRKHIPIEYLLSSVSQRLALLQGLMDSDGYVSVKRGMCEFCQKNGKLADDVFVLLRSLGYKPTRHVYKSTIYGKDCGEKVRVNFIPDKGESIFRLSRKQKRLDEKKTTDSSKKDKFFIARIEEDEDSLVNCIEVEGGLYLAGEELVITHNSQGSSRFLPAFMLGHNPDLRVAICSYSATIARDFNRDVQRLIDCEEYRAVFPETTLSGERAAGDGSYLRNSDVFEVVSHTGSLRAVGRGGSLTSKTVDLMIMDDLYKDSAEANSPVVREAAWNWYTKVARSRLHNDSRQLIVFTRWHEDDIIGRLLNSEPYVELHNWDDLDAVPEDTWAVVNFAAIKGGEPTDIDQRQKGEALWDARHSKERLLALRDLDPVGFECLYQGNPGNAEGKLYQPFKTWIEKADWGTYIRSGCYVDVADEGDDYLFAASYDVYKSENQVFNEQTKRFEPLLFVLITDVVFTSEPTDVTTITVPQLINANNVQKVWVESNSGGSQFEKVIKKKVRALTVPFYQSENKEARIVTNAPFVNQHIIMPFGWEDRFLKFHSHLTSFLRDFSANKHDDDADGLTGIYEKEVASGNLRPYSASSRGVKVH